MGFDFKIPEIVNVAVMAARVIQSSVKRFGLGHWGTLIDGLNVWGEIQATPTIALQFREGASREAGIRQF